MELSADERTRMLYESRYKMEWDNRAREDVAERKGHTDGLITVAKNLLDAGDSIDKIIRMTGLSCEEIESLQQQ
ncbi:MAG: hypothetical protein LBC86_05190 [Oscillospiraceae bacterium]|jgi:predicted transposase/invertase (TIGR01784 family)|nr:hypothetical protein [Oscillospiraceae bacterium]